jgi:hypothetical protein
MRSSRLRCGTTRRRRCGIPRCDCLTQATSDTRSCTCLVVSSATRFGQHFTTSVLMIATVTWPRYARFPDPGSVSGRPRRRRGATTTLASRLVGRPGRQEGAIDGRASRSQGNPGSSLRPRVRCAAHVTCQSRQSGPVGAERRDRLRPNPVAAITLGATSPSSPAGVRWLDCCLGSSSARSRTFRSGVRARRHSSGFVNGEVIEVPATRVLRPQHRHCWSRCRVLPVAGASSRPARVLLRPHFEPRGGWPTRPNSHDCSRLHRSARSRVLPLPAVKQELHAKCSPRCRAHVFSSARWTAALPACQGSTRIPTGGQIIPEGVAGADWANAAARLRGRAVVRRLCRSGSEAGVSRILPSCGIRSLHE